MRQNWVNLQEDLQQKYKKCWHQFMGGEEVSDLPNPLILESWRRCKLYNVDPAQKTAREMLDINALNKLREKNDFLIEVSIPMLENIYEYFKDSGYTVVLSEANGYLIEVFGDKKIQGLAHQGRWILGACWSEMSAGTNVIGMSIATDQPISLTGYELYCLYSHNWTGAGAPIHDPDGKIIGAIGLAGLITNYTPHTLGMVIAAAKAIEIQFSMKKAWHECALANQYKNIIVDSIYEGLLVTDANGIINMINRQAQEILGSPGDKLIGVHISKLFNKTLVDYLVKRHIQIIDVQDEISVGDHRVKCTITFQHIMADGGVYSGSVIVINKIERAKKLAHKMLNEGATCTFADIIGNNPSFCETLDLAITVAPRKCNVLLLGASGTGKDIFAQAIHNASARRMGPFIAINCGAIPKELIGSELFGYSDGAFTGASKGGKMGKFELAEGGTLFLDEIGEMPVEQQKTLLRVLEEEKISRLGGQEMISVDVRIVAATNKDLEHEIKAGTFREDLYYRLNIISITMIPLKERKDDIKPLATAFLARICDKMGQPHIKVPEDVWDLLYDYDWPGNIRELQNVMERAVVLSVDNTLSCRMFNISNKTKPNDIELTANPIKNDLNRYEADMLKNLLQRNRWNISKSSLELDVSRTTLYRKMGLYDIKIPPEFRNV